MQAIYNTQIQQPAQYYHQMYGTSSSTIGAPYYYGYSLQAPRTALSGPQAQRIPGPSYLYFPTSMEGSFSSFPSPTIQPARHPFPSSSTAGTCLLFILLSNDLQLPIHKKHTHLEIHNIYLCLIIRRKKHT